MYKSEQCAWKRQHLKNQNMRNISNYENGFSQTLKTYCALLTRQFSVPSIDPSGPQAHLLTDMVASLTKVV